MVNPKTTDPEQTLKIAASIAREAGMIALASYRTRFEIEQKRTSIDLVTQTDLASEALIRKRLNQYFPDHGLLAEEGGVTGPESDSIWIVDPLDGTTNFAHGHPFFCVSMALKTGDTLEIGVIHAPVLGITWTAQQGQGAHRNGARISVSEVESLGSALCASGFPYDRWTNPDNNTAEWSSIVKLAQGVRRCGSAALDLALIADGTYDGYWEKRLNPWDLAAGVLLVEEAGGLATSHEGESVPPWPETIVASNGKFHDEILEVLRLEAGDRRL